MCVDFLCECCSTLYPKHGLPLRILVAKNAETACHLRHLLETNWIVVGVQKR